MSNLIIKGDKIYLANDGRVGHDMIGEAVSQMDGFGLVSVDFPERPGGPSLYAREQFVAAFARDGEMWHVLYR